MHTQDSVISSDAVQLYSHSQQVRSRSHLAETPNNTWVSQSLRGIEREGADHASPSHAIRGGTQHPQCSVQHIWHHVIVPPDVLDTALGMLCARQPSYVDMFQKYGSIESFKIVDLQLAVRPAAARHGCVQYCID